MDERLVNLALNIHHFNQDVMKLNIKYAEEIESLNRIIDELKDKLLTLENERDVLKSTLSDIKADIKYLLEHGENIYIRRKYSRSDKE